MQIEVENKYDGTDIYNCSSKECQGCGLRFLCFTERKKMTLTWSQFCSVLKGKNKPKLVYKG
uniref:Uncharacterized protein n=1 Tax=viral metagenome TaxID=1070528 RepID=A0A6M3JK03_9ZZZZ